MSSDDRRSIEVDSSRLLANNNSNSDSGGSGYGTISIDDIQIPEHESLAEYYNNSSADEESALVNRSPAKKRSWLGNIVYWLSTSSSEREAARLTAQQLSDRLVRAVWSDSMSEVLRTIQQGASINAPGRLDGKGIGWCRDNHEFRIMAPFEGGVPASPLHYAALKDRHGILKLLVTLGASKRSSIKLRTNLMQGAQVLTPHDLLNHKGLSPNAEMLEPAPPTFQEQVHEACSCCAACWCCCCCCIPDHDQ